MKHNVSIRNRKSRTSPTGNINVFTDNDLNKVGIIKAIRRATGLGLKEAKDLADELSTHRAFEIDTRRSTIHPAEALKELREQGLEVERSLADPISLLRKAAEDALDVDDVALARDILNVVVKHQGA